MFITRCIAALICCLVLVGCQNTPQPIYTMDVSYQDEGNYKVPEDEQWRLTWESPYEPGDISPAYDVRVLGNCYTSSGASTLINAHDDNPGKNGMLNINATNEPAEIWVPSGTEFYIANDFVKVRVEAYKNEAPKQ